MPLDRSQLRNFVFKHGLELKQFLGLNHWTIYYHFDPLTSDDSDVVGRCKLDPDYNAAHIYLDPNGIDDLDEASRYLRHELFHIFGASYDHAHNIIHQLMAGEHSGTRERLFTHAHEQLVVALERMWNESQMAVMFSRKGEDQPSETTGLGKMYICDVPVGFVSQQDYAALHAERNQLLDANEALKASLLAADQRNANQAHNLKVIGQERNDAQEHALELEGQLADERNKHRNNAHALVEVTDKLAKSEKDFLDYIEASGEARKQEQHAGQKQLDDAIKIRDGQILYWKSNFHESARANDDMKKALAHTQLELEKWKCEYAQQNAMLAEKIITAHTDAQGAHNKPIF